MNIEYLLYYIGISYLTFEAKNSHQVDDYLKKAEKCFRSSIKFAPNNEYFRNGLANVLLSQGYSKYKEAEAQYRISIQLNSLFSYAYNGLGSLYFNLGETDKALGFYKISTNINPNNWKPYHNRGLIFLYLENNTTRALTEFYKCKNKCEFKSPFVHSTLSLSYLFKLIDESDNMSDEEKIILQEKANFEAQLAIDCGGNNNADHCWNFALIKLWERNFEEAYSFWREAFKIGYKQKEEQCIATYGYIAASTQHLAPIYEKQTEDIEINIGNSKVHFLEKLEALLNDESKKLYTRKGRLKIILKDLEIVQTILSEKNISIHELIQLFNQAIHRKVT